ncbi:MAG: AAA family ATPase [Desulfovibrionaceae bacterium]
MSRVLAVAGKGGVGKTTLSGLLVLRLAARGLAPILAVDADPNSCLDEALGLTVQATVGSLREDLDEARRMSMDKQRYLEMKIAEALTEGEDFDLVAMGRPEGPGCYCYANNVLKDVLARMAASYPWLVVDNEAGLENLSRRLIASSEALILVGDGSRRGLATMERIFELAREMGVAFEKVALVVNRVKPGLSPLGLDELAGKTSADAVIQLPENEQLARLDAEGAGLAGLAPANPLIAGVDRLLDDLNLH